MSKNTIDVVFGQPKLPDHNKRIRKDTLEWVRASDILKSKPGEWAQLIVKDRREQAYSVVYRLRKGVVFGYPKGEFEYLVRPALSGSGFGVFARYIGSKDDDLLDNLEWLKMPELAKLCEHHGIKRRRSKADTITALREVLKQA